jgi:hypothetical protein
MKYFAIDYGYLFINIFFIGSLAKICGKEKQDIYRSIVCFMVTMTSTTFLYDNIMTGTIMDILQQNDVIKTINHIMCAYFIIDTYLLYKYKNNRISLWAHHIFCLISYLTLMEFYCMTLVAFAEIVSIVYLFKLKNEDFFILNNNIYRFIIFTFVRIPFWFWTIYLIFTNIYKYERLYVAKCLNILAPILMCSLDVLWLNANIEIIYKNTVEYYEGDLSKISKK